MITGVLIKTDPQWRRVCVVVTLRDRGCAPRDVVAYDGTDVSEAVRIQSRWQVAMLQDLAKMGGITG